MGSKDFKIEDAEVLYAEPVPDWMKELPVFWVYRDAVVEKTPEGDIVYAQEYDG